MEIKLTKDNFKETVMEADVCSSISGQRGAALVK